MHPDIGTAVVDGVAAAALAQVAEAVAKNDKARRHERRLGRARSTGRNQCGQSAHERQQGAAHPVHILGRGAATGGGRNSHSAKLLAIKKPPRLPLTAFAAKQMQKAKINAC